MKKYYAQVVRDFVAVIQMGPLVAVRLPAMEQREIAPARSIQLQRKAGQNFQFKSKKRRDEWVAAVNAEHPGAAAAIDPYEKINAEVMA